MALLDAVAVPNVVPEGSKSGKGQLALVAVERGLVLLLLDLVVTKSQMSDQVPLVEVIFVARVAAEPEIRVDVRVLRKVRLGDESLLADAALEEKILGVPSLVRLQVSFLVAGVLADVAGKFFRPRVDQLVSCDIHRALERFSALVAAEGVLDSVSVLQVLHQLCHVEKRRAALDTLVRRFIFFSSLILARSEINLKFLNILVTLIFYL